MVESNVAMPTIVRGPFCKEQIIIPGQSFSFSDKAAWIHFWNSYLYTVVKLELRKKVIHELNPSSIVNLKVIAQTKLYLHEDQV